MEEINSLSIIDAVSIQQVQATMEKISQFQKVIQTALHQNHDYGILPGTEKPTLLKPGAEKILMMMGLRSEFEIVDSTRDWENGFFQYQVRCKLYKNDTLITEGLGSANTRESRYVKGNPFTLDNTILKMAKKRALVDATLLVASLSDIFTQDMEDIDLNGTSVQDSVKQGRQAIDNGATISTAQAKRMFAIAKGNEQLLRGVLSAFGYQHSADVKKIDYEKICDEIEAAVKELSDVTADAKA